MVKRLDGTFALYSPEEVKELSKEGKITIEYLHERWANNRFDTKACFGVE